MMGVRLSLPLPLLLAALAPSLTPTAAADDDPNSTVSVYAPGYRSENWDDLAGSVITSDSVATTYTIFCPNTEDCAVSGPLPFTFAEGPSTFKYSGSLEGRLTAILSCQLASTTAATCTEYSSFGPGFAWGNITGPTEVTSTATYSGSDVQWGILTMSSPAPAQNAATPTGDDGVDTPDPTNTAWYFAAATSSARATGRVDPTGAMLQGATMLLAVLMV